MRLFVAIGCPDDVKDRLSDLREDIVELGRFKLVEYENLHLSVKFLGEVGADRRGRIESELEKLRIKPFILSVKGVGVFPNPGKARVLWAGIDRGYGEAVRLNAQVDAALSPIGFERDQRFKPHITLARAKGPSDRKMLLKFLSCHSDTEFGSYKPESFDLVKSSLTPDGPKYETIGKYGIN